MKTKVLTLVICLPAFLGAQCPNAPIELTSQADIDAFTVNYPNCTQLTHDLIIFGEDSDIVSLAPLSVITHTQDLYVEYTNISDLTGLHNLVSTAYLSIGGNPGLTDFSGLDNLESTGLITMFFNSNLVSLDGAPNLSSVGGIFFYENSSLQNIQELSEIQTLGQLGLSGNNSLTSLVGLESLQTITGDVFIANGPISNFNDLISLNEIQGELFIVNMSQLTDISAFSNLTSVDDLIILACDSLQSLNGLENISEVRGTMRIGFLPLLEDLSVFENLTSVQSIDFYENNSLQNLDGLSNLTAIEQSLYLLANPNLVDISGIGNLSASGMNAVVVFDNVNLDTCDYPLICEAVFDEDVYDQVEFNGSGCYTSQQVFALCILGVDDLILENNVHVLPNPVTDRFVIQYPSDLNLLEVEIYSSLGGVVFRTNEPQVSLANLSAGLYFAKITFENGMTVKRILKQ